MPKVPSSAVMFKNPSQLFSSGRVCRKRWPWCVSGHVPAVHTVEEHNVQMATKLGVGQFGIFFLFYFFGSSLKPISAEGEKNKHPQSTIWLAYVFEGNYLKNRPSLLWALAGNPRTVYCAFSKRRPRCKFKLIIQLSLIQIYFLPKIGQRVNYAAWQTGVCWPARITR